MISLDQEKIIEDVNRIGYKMQGINDLKKIGPKNKDVIPVLLHHLQTITDVRDKDFLVRCLGVKGYKEVTPVLLDEFYKASHDQYKWAIGNSLEIIQDKSALPELVKIARNKEHGRARRMIVIAIGKLGGPAEAPLLIELLEDPEVQLHAIDAIGIERSCG